MNEQRISVPRAQFISLHKHECYFFEREEEWDYFTSIIGSIYTHNIIEHTTFIYFGRRYLVINTEHLRLKVHFLSSKSSGLSREDCFHDAWKFNSLRKFLQINNVVFYDG